MQNPIVHLPATAPKSKQYSIHQQPTSTAFIQQKSNHIINPKLKKHPHTLYLACFQIPAHNTKPGKKRTENKAFYSH